jgi:hypothetical protein
MSDLGESNEEQKPGLLEKLISKTPSAYMMNEVIGVMTTPSLNHSR